MKSIVIVLILSARHASAEPTSTIPVPLPAERDPCIAFTADADYVTQSLIMQLEDREVPLRIPRSFFEDFWDQRRGFTDTAQLFRVEIGTFLPVSRAETGRRNKQNIWNWMTFVIGDRRPLEDLAVLSAESRSGVIDGNRNRILESYEPLPGPFGLTEIRSDALQPTPAFRSNTYIARLNDGTLSAVISCNTQGSVAYPICIHWFRAAGVDVELDYRRVELPNWQALQSDVTGFLTCAITSPL
ncbi:MAG: hypothetical protein QM656_00010 [Paracoccaceae bacterium]